MSIEVKLYSHLLNSIQHCIILQHTVLYNYTNICWGPTGLIPLATGKQVRERHQQYSLSVKSSVCEVNNPALHFGPIRLATLVTSC